MNDPHKNRLIQQTLESGNLDDFRSSSLEAFLGAGRSRRRMRRIRNASLAITVLLALAGTALSIVYHSSPSPTPAVTEASAPKKDSGVKVISEEELFALFPDRSLALTGPPGRQTLIFLDH